MTAREKIAFQLGLLGIADAEIEASLDAFAHELAEQQRGAKVGGTEMRAPGRSYDAYRWNRCVDQIADLIDPEVTAWHRTDPGDDLTGRTRHRWHVEGWENGEWGMVASPSDSIPEAQRKQDGVGRRVPGAVTRIVRESTTYTVEEQQP